MSAACDICDSEKGRRWRYKGGCFCDDCRDEGYAEMDAIEDEEDKKSLGFLSWFF